MITTVTNDNKVTVIKVQEIEKKRRGNLIKTMGMYLLTSVMFQIDVGRIISNLLKKFIALSHTDIPANNSDENIRLFCLYFMSLFVVFSFKTFKAHMKKHIPLFAVIFSNR